MKPNGHDTRVAELARWISWSATLLDFFPNDGADVAAFGGGIALATTSAEGVPVLTCYDRPQCVEWHKAVVADLGSRVVETIREYQELDDLPAILLQMLSESLWEAEPGDEDTVIHPENANAKE